MLVWDNKPLIYGGKFFDFEYLKPRYIYLTQTVGGTISADKLSGMSGDIVSLSNTPSAHYVFLNYNTTGAALTGNQFEITNNNVSVNGTFSAEPQGRLLLLQQTGGTITADKTYGYSGETANLSYTADSDYYFNGWSNTGGSINGNVFTWGSANALVKGNFVSVAPNYQVSGTRPWAHTNSVSSRRNTYIYSHFDDIIVNAASVGSDCIVAINYDIHTTNNSTAVQFNSDLNVSGRYLSWNSTQSKWQDGGFDSKGNGFVNGPYTANQDITSMFPVIATTYAESHTIWLNSNASSNGGKIYYPVNYNWHNRYHVKYLVHNVVKTNMSTYNPPRSLNISAYVDNTLVYTAVGGMQYYNVNAFVGGCGFYNAVKNGTTNYNSSACPGSAKFNIGLYNNTRVNDAYRWLMSL